MNTSAIKDLLFKMADDALIIGHRNSEWTGIGPMLEEDLAFSSMAQDKIGHALALYTILHEVLGEEHVDLLEAGSMQRVTLQVAEGAGLRRGERGGIQEQQAAALEEGVNARQQVGAQRCHDEEGRETDGRGLGEYQPESAHRIESSG